MPPLDQLLGQILFLRPIKRQAVIDQVDRFRVGPMQRPTGSVQSRSEWREVEQMRGATDISRPSLVRVKVTRTIQSVEQDLPLHSLQRLRMLE
jgi:hypothetical protein